MRSRAELYDWELAHVSGRGHQDLAFYAGLAAGRAGPVLELGCGTGRLTVPLDAVGLDIDPAMLQMARRRGARRLVRADMRRFAFAGRFSLVAIPYNTLQLLASDAEVTACLRAAADHLLPGGVVGFEVTDFQAGVVRTEVAPERLAHADGVTLYGALSHDLPGRVTTYRRHFEEGGRHRRDEIRLRCLRAEDLERLLAGAGLAPVEVVADGPRRLVAAAAASRRA